ncbi:MAG: hypothetical protein KAR32_04245, partial [Candidatus Omnitrophica bacterium]|nr:hypothetical protein [Candidatus Omnitrophota bacterium]
MYRISDDRSAGNNAFGVGSVTSAGGIAVGTNGYKESWNVSEARVRQSGIEFLGSAIEAIKGGVKAVSGLVEYRSDKVLGMCEVQKAQQTKNEFLYSAPRAIEGRVIAIDTAVTELFDSMRILVDYLLRGSEIVPFAAASSPVSSSSNRRVAPVSTSARVAELLKAAHKAVSGYTHTFIDHISSTGMAIAALTVVILAMLAYSIERHAPGAVAQITEALSHTGDLIGMMSTYTVDSVGQVSSIIGSENQSISTELTTGGALWSASILTTLKSSSSISLKSLAQTALSALRTMTKRNSSSSSSLTTVARFIKEMGLIIRGMSWKANNVNPSEEWSRTHSMTRASPVTLLTALAYSTDNIKATKTRGGRQNSTVAGISGLPAALFKQISRSGTRVLRISPNTRKEASENLSEVKAGEADKLYRGRYLEASPANSSPIKETSSSPVVESIVRTITGSRGLLSVGAAVLLAAPVAAFVLPAGTLVPVILTVVQLAASKFMFSRLALFRKGLEVSDEEGGIKNLKIFNALDVLYKGIAAFAFMQLFLYWEVGLTASILMANVILAAIAVRHPVAAKAVITGLYFVLAVGMLMSLMLSGGHASWAG